MNNIFNYYNVNYARGFNDEIKNQIMDNIKPNSTFLFTDTFHPKFYLIVGKTKRTIRVVQVYSNTKNNFSVPTKKPYTVNSNFMNKRLTNNGFRINNHFVKFWDGQPKQWS